MNIKQIRELAQILSQNELNSLEIVEGDTRIRLEKGGAQTAASAVQQASGQSETAQPIQTAPAEKTERDAGVDFNRLTEVKSPLVGVLYAAPSPEAEPYVKIGSTVKKGDILCIVEAMKLMNEIVAEQDGTVVDVCAHNGDVVEYGQTLFKLS